MENKDINWNTKCNFGDTMLGTGIGIAVIILALTLGIAGCCKITNTLPSTFWSGNEPQIEKGQQK